MCLSFLSNDGIIFSQIPPFHPDLGKIPVMKNFILLGLFVTSTLSFAGPVESILNYRGNAFSYYGSQSLTTPDEKIEKLVIVVHGSERNADTYFRTMEALAAQENQTENTLIVATHFKLKTDKLVPQEFTWTDEGWLRGDESLVNPKVSSFELLDHIIDLAADQENFPNLKSVILTGHSAGGQFTQRYAIGSQIELNYPDIQFRYVVANPGSYAYLTPKRPLAIAADSSCKYNDYKYGLEHLNRYMSRIRTKKLVKRYIRRNVVYLVGEKDIISEDIDQECPAQVQGKTRLERGNNFKRLLDEQFPKNQHAIYTVPAIGHTQWGMYTSQIGTKILFH